MPTKTLTTKKRKYLEKDFQTDFNKWLKSIHYKTGAFELKATPGISLPFNAVQEHQESALFAAKHGNFVFKIPDLGNQNPFDCFMLVMVPAFIVVMFNSKEQKQKEFFMIDIDMWLEEKQRSNRESLTVERAREIGRACQLC